MLNTLPGLNYLEKADRRIRHIANWAQFIVNPKPQLVCQTLDHDDVEIARQLLKHPDRWVDPLIEEKFAKDFAKWNGSRHAFSFLSGRAALSACIFALGLMPDDEVIVPGFTCVVVPNAFDFAKVKVVYCDIELETYGIDLAALEKKITPRTKAILIQHLFGLVCRDYEKIIEFARDRKLYVIEDCAHSTGAEFKGVKVGNFGDVAFYSSELSKIYNTIQGGVVITNNDSIAKNLSRFHEHALYPDNERIEKQLHNVIVNYYRFKHPLRNYLGPRYESAYRDKLYDSTSEEEVLGVKPKDYGCKMPAAIARIGLNQLNKLDHYSRKRRHNAKRWALWCEKNHYQKPLVVTGSVPVYLRYPVMVESEKKRDLAWAMKDPGVVPGRWFLSNIHPAKRSVPDCPNADKAVRQCINFPTLF